MSTTTETTESVLHLSSASATAGSSSQHPANYLRIQRGRLLDTIHETALFGAKFQWGPASTETGVCRLALSDEDRAVKNWFRKETEALGCTVTVDEVGNMFALFPGQKDALPTGMGSHLDTQPTGGRYDGILGVLSGLEVLRTLKENNYVPRYPIVLINWMNEEGARFPMSIMASSVWAGLIPKEQIYAMESITDDKPVTVLDELKRIGYKGTQGATYKDFPLAAHFEIHIEQGPILEQENKKIGIVKGVQAYTWTKVTVNGKAQHTGTTPMHMRNDALLAAARMVALANDTAKKFDGLASVGTLELGPGVVNVIPDDVTFILDMRNVQDSKLKQMNDYVREEFNKICKLDGDKVSVSFEEISKTPATHFNSTCINCVRESAFELFGEDQCREMVSGAGHDSCATNFRCPTSMIFIPSRGGISHNPEEYSTPEQVHEGFQTLLGAVLKFDKQRTE